VSRSLALAAGTIIRWEIPPMALTPLALLLALPAADPVWMVETKPTRNVEAVLTFEVEAPRMAAREWIAYVPRLPELPTQSPVSSRMTPPGRPVSDLGPGQRPLLFARVAGGPTTSKSLRLTVTHQAQLHSRLLVEAAAGTSVPPVPPLPPALRKHYLNSGPTIDHASPEVQDWLTAKQLRRASGESDIDLARRIHLAIGEGFSYRYQPDQDRRASAVCGAGQTDCGGLCVLFVAALRANGVPARLLSGRWATSAKKDEKVNGFAYSQGHVKAEFFTDGVGWVPVDVTGSVLRKKPAERLWFFGRDTGEFVTLHVDPDLVLESVHFGRKSEPWMQGAAWWVVGPGSLDGMTLQLDWQVRDLP
jgi:transglutaminase-like putative cysteine protease